LSECEIDTSLALAAIKQQLGAFEEARDHATFAESFATRGEQRLRCVSARLRLAEVAWHCKSPSEARKWATSARELAQGEKRMDTYSRGVALAERCLERMATGRG
jgi:hypothetical protein